MRHLLLLAVALCTFSTVQAQVTPPVDCPLNTVPFLIEFEQGIPSEVLSEGEVAGTATGRNDVYTNMVIYANNPHEGIDVAVVFDANCEDNPGPITDGTDDDGSIATAHCTGGDTDLGTPNVANGGPGVGAGGAATNTFQLGNILIVQNISQNSATITNGDGDTIYTTPNDENACNASNPCLIAFDFIVSGVDQDFRIDQVGTIDADGGTIEVLLFDDSEGDNSFSSQTPLATRTEANLGDNSVDVLNFTSGGGTNTGVSRMEVRNSGSGGLGSFSGCAPGDPLPVELSLFESTVDGKDVLLRWATVSETNNAGFEVQHRDLTAAQKADWHVLDFIDGMGTTIEPQAYHFRASDLAPGTHLFRLRQVDFDGAFEYSPTVEVIVDLAESYLIEAAYPNPFNPESTLRFGVQQAQHVDVGLYNTLGQRVQTLFTGMAESGRIQHVTINGSDLPSGMYLVRVVGERFAETQTVTLLK